MEHNLAQRLWQFDYCYNYDNYEKKYNINRLKDIYFVPSTSGLSTMKRKSEDNLSEEQLKKRWKEHKLAMDLDDLQRKNEATYLFKLLNKYLGFWWD